MPSSSPSIRASLSCSTRSIVSSQPPAGLFCGGCSCPFSSCLRPSMTCKMTRFGDLRDSSLSRRWAINFRTSLSPRECRRAVVFELRNAADVSDGKVVGRVTDELRFDREAGPEKERELILLGIEQIYEVQRETAVVGRSRGRLTPRQGSRFRDNTARHCHGETHLFGPHAQAR